MVQGGDRGSGGVRGGRYRLRGPKTIESNTSRTVRYAPARKTRILFVCIGNSCRSQMAEAFARAYGSDILVVSSAGTSPAPVIAPSTKKVLAERNLSIESHFPKSIHLALQEPFDIVVNMSGVPLQIPGARMIEWSIPDPIGQPDPVFRNVATQIEALIMGLIIELRNEPRAAGAM